MFRWSEDDWAIWADWRACSDRDAEIGRLVERAVTGDLVGVELLGVRGADGHARGVTAWIPSGGPGAFLWVGATSPEGPPDWSREVPELVRHAVARGWTRLTVRLEPGRHPELRGALLDSGFARRGERVECRVAVASLPPEDDPRLTWRSLRNEGLQAGAELLARAAAADPLGPDVSDPLEALRALGTAAFQLGRLDGVPAVLVGAEVDRRTGWSRVPYLAVEPALRGRGLGRAGLRRGGALLRVRGGRIWEDGCAADNAAVRHLLDELGVTWVRRCEELYCRMNG